MSCLSGSQEFSKVENDAYNIWHPFSSSDPTDSGLAGQLGQQFGVTPLGDFYFILQGNSPSPGAPVFDFRSIGPNSGNPNAIFIGNTTEDIPSPDGVANFDWLQFQQVSGELASTVYQVKTVQGTPGPLNANVSPLDCTVPVTS
jgi:hypothetical protein